MEKVIAAAEKYRTDDGNTIKFYFPERKLMTSLKSVKFITLNTDSFNELAAAAGTDNVRFL